MRSKKEADHGLNAILLRAFGRRTWRSRVIGPRGGQGAVDWPAAGGRVLNSRHAEDWGLGGGVK